MSCIRSEKTKVECRVFKELRRRGINFRSNYRQIIGSPDIAVVQLKKAIFIDGDFWHGYRYPQWKKRLPNKFWRDKIERNINRDALYRRKLRGNGWKVLRVWEHEIEKRFNQTIKKISQFLESNK